MATAPELASSSRLRVAACDDDLTLDCTALTFIDSAGVAVDRAALRAANVDGTAARVLDVLGL